MIPISWALGLMCLLLLAGGATAPLYSSATSDTSSDDATTSTTTTIYGNHLRPLLEEKEGTQTLNVYGPGGRIVAQIVRDADGNEDVRYLLGDHLGSTRLVLGQAGNAVAGYDYTPYGETTMRKGAGSDLRYRYTGHPADDALGSYHTPHRAYDPSLGRFLEVDPKRANHSPYIYASDAPVNNLDTTGGEDLPFIYVDYQSFPGMSNDQVNAKILNWLGLPESHTDAFLNVEVLLPSPLRHMRDTQGVPLLSEVAEMEFRPASLIEGANGGLSRNGISYFIFGPDSYEPQLHRMFRATSSILGRRIRASQHSDIADILGRNIVVYDKENAAGMQRAFGHLTAQPGGFTRRMIEARAVDYRSLFADGIPVFDDTGQATATTGSLPRLEGPSPLATGQHEENLRFLSRNRPSHSDWRLRWTPEQQTEFAMRMPRPLSQGHWDQMTVGARLNYIFGDP